MDKNIYSLLKAASDNKDFDTLSTFILNRSTLLINNIPHKIIEIEFYCYDEKNNHPDCFTHCNELQQNFARFYFHRYGTRATSTPKEGTYKGLDITFGQAPRYLGILIRSIQLPKGTIIQGPCNCVNHILDVLKMESAREIIDKYPHLEQQSFLDEKYEDSILSLKSSSQHISDSKEYCEDILKSHKHIYKSPRVGLTLNQHNVDDKKDWIMRLYRHTTYPLLKKNKNLIALSLIYHHKLTIDDTRDLTKMSIKKSQEIINNFIQGQSQHKPEDFIGRLNSQDLCRLFGACFD